MATSFTEAAFYTIDYVIMILFLVVSMIIGVYFGVIKKQKTTEEYLLGNRQMQMIPVALSMLVSFQSAISVIGTPMEMYVYDTMMFHVYIGICLSMVVQYFFIVPLLYPLKLTSVYEYLGRRFDSRAVQLLGTYIGMLQTILYMAVVLFAPALALEAVAGIPLWLSIIVIGIIGTAYTSLGGIKSVIWTDVFQFVMLYGGMTVILIMGGLKVGSLADIINISREGGRVEFGRYDFDPRVRHTLWTCIVGGMFNWLPTCCNQSSIQRICSMKSEKDAKKAVLLYIPLMMLYAVLLTLVGLVVYAYFVVYECDPIASGIVANANQLIPFFVIHVLSHVPGLAGIFVAALFSGALSSLSSGINSMAANTLQDILVNYLEGSLQVKKTLFAKAIVCVYGGITIALAYGIKEMTGPVTQLAMTAFGACGGPVVGIMCLGAVFPQANWIGAFVGGMAGIVFNIWLAISCFLFGNKAVKSPPITTVGCFPNATTLATNYTVGITDLSTVPSIVANSLDATTPVLESSSDSGHFPLYDISYLYLSLTGIIVSMGVGLVLSYMTGKDRGNPTDPIYILPGLRKFWKIGYKHVDDPDKKDLSNSSNNGDNTIYDLERRVTPLGSPSLSWMNKCRDDEL